jgi:predicted ribosome quality control (RQC) complex YloA/Tae2 family protein
MEKYEMSSLDLRFLVGELGKSLIGGYFRKIYQYAYAAGKAKTHQFLFEVFVPGRGNLWLYADKNKLFITNYKKPSPAEPPNFCLLLRKHLEGSKILGIHQHEFDRIIELSTENNVLIIELFSDGNVVLCNSEKSIISPLYVQEWKDRELKPKLPYKYPPARINPFAVSFEYFREFLSRFDKKIIAVLAAGFGFGPVYAKEICIRTKIDEATPAERFSANLSIILFNTIRDMDNLHYEPTLYEGFVSPFPLQNTEAGNVVKHTDNFSVALDEFFSGQQIKSAEEFEEDAKQGHKEKFERILKDQESSLEKWKSAREEKKSKADLIYSHYATVENILEVIGRLKSSGMEWNEIKSVVKELPEMNAIKEIREKEGRVLAELEGQALELDFRKSLAENAGTYYEKSKVAKRKISGVQEAMKKIKGKMEKEPAIEKIEKLVRFEKKEKKWFEKFRWFRTSDGLLVVGGKDATSNEVLIKKHAEAHDLVLHSLVQGAPFVVIKAEGKAISDAAKKEAAEFAAAYSKAWQSRLGTADVYCITPDQVSKQAKPGEYLAKGAFMIYGEREWFRNTELKVAIGVKIDRQHQSAEVLSGPVSSVKTNADYAITVRPGDKKAPDLARVIKSLLIKNAKENDRSFIGAIPLDAFQKLIPLGTGELILEGLIFRF